MTWWCSARGLPWDGSWQAYPGVWLFVALVLLATVPLRARGPGSPWWRVGALFGGAMVLWVVLDWPIGPLGAGYLAYVHSVQFLMLAMVVPPLLLLGLDREVVRDRLDRRPRLRRILALVTQPLFAIVVFAATMVFTHLPVVVDGLMATQLGAFVLDTLWLIAGILFWWPVIIRVPERAHFPPLMQMLYLFFGTQPHLYIAMWLLAADFPAYATYELAPRVTSVSPITDQQIAGALMLAFGATYVIGVISVLFFRWAAQHRSTETA